MGVPDVRVALSLSNFNMTSGRIGEGRKEVAVHAVWPWDWNVRLGRVKNGGWEGFAYRVRHLSPVSAINQSEEHLRCPKQSGIGEYHTRGAKHFLAGHCSGKQGNINDTGY